MKFGDVVSGVHASFVCVWAVIWALCVLYPLRQSKAVNCSRVRAYQSVRWLSGRSESVFTPLRPSSMTRFASCDYILSRSSFQIIHDLMLWWAPRQVLSGLISYMVFIKSFVGGFFQVSSIPLICILKVSGRSNPVCGAGGAKYTEINTGSQIPVHSVIVAHFRFIEQTIISRAFRHVFHFFRSAYPLQHLEFSRPSSNTRRDTRLYRASRCSTVLLAPRKSRE